MPDFNNPEPIDVRVWMTTYTTPNPIENLARINAYLASILGEVLNLQKDIVKEVADRISEISALNVLVKKFASTDPKPDAVTILGGTQKEAIDIFTRMKAAGVKNMDFWISFAALNPAGGTTVTNAQISNWSLELQALSESEQNRSQQESLRLQTYTNRLTQANDQASTAIQKDGQGKGTVTSNLRGSGG